MKTTRLFSLLLILFILPSILIGQKKKQEEVQDPKAPAPVILKGDTLFYIRAPFGPFTPRERANALTTKLNELVTHNDFTADSLNAIKVENDYYIFYKDRVITVISKKDTVGTGSTLNETASSLVTELRTSLISHNRSFNIWRVLTNIGLTLLVVFIFLGIVWLLNRLFKWIYSWIDRSKGKIFRSIKLQNYEFLTVEREYAIAIYFLRVMKIVMIIVSVLIALPVIFSIFPATEGITRKIIDLVWEPLKNILLNIVNYIPSLITIVVIYFIFRYIIRFIRFLSLEVERKSLVLPGFHPEWAKPTYNIIRVLLYAFMFVVIFPYLPGSESPVFRGVSVFLGVLISLGSTSLIGNAMAGLVITYMRPYKIGDRIKIDDVVGDVTEKTMMITRIRTIKNEDVTIPNAKVLTGYTVNYTTPALEKEGLIIHTTVTIGYDAPWRKVHELLITAAEATEGVSKKPRPFVLQMSLDDFFISYQINAYIKDPHIVLKIKSELHQNIQDNFNKAGVEIMSPHYRAERDGNDLAMPREWLDKPMDTSGGKGKEEQEDNESKPEKKE